MYNIFQLAHLRVLINKHDVKKDEFVMFIKNMIYLLELQCEKLTFFRSYTFYVKLLSILCFQRKDEG